MQSKVARKDHYCIITYEGDTTGLMPGPLPEVIDALNKGAIAIVLNLSKLRFLNPNGVEAMRESLQIVKKRQASMGIAAPQPNVRRTLNLSGLVPEIPIYYNEREAIANLDLIDYTDTAKKEGTDRLLICQNDLPIAGALRDALRRHPLNPHFRMMPCRNLKKAMEILLEERIDLIIIESGFPLVQVTGFIETVETDERLPTIPILVVSDDKNLGEADLMIRNGAHEILRYPFLPIEVLVRLQTLISHMKDHRPYHPPEKVVQPRGWRA